MATRINTQALDNLVAIRRLPDGSVEYWPADMAQRYGVVQSNAGLTITSQPWPGRRKTANQLAKAHRRKAAGKPSYRQRQRTAKSAHASRSIPA
jgi:hypothetical protein